MVGNGEEVGSSVPIQEEGQEKDFVLFVDKEGRFLGDYEAPAEDAPPQGPINEETGEINWDCPCLQSALAPPCGEYFKAAFSCFVASKSEPKGNDCLEQFSAMQDCFRAHPEIYLKGYEDAATDTPTVHESKVSGLNPHPPIAGLDIEASSSFNNDTVL